MEEPSQELYVAASILRLRFAELQVLDQLARGELSEEVKREKLAPESRVQPPGTLSQIVFYRREDVLIAIVHQYLLPDGRIGASGLPDPKWLPDGDLILKYRRD